MFFSIGMFGPLFEGMVDSWSEEGMLTFSTWINKFEVGDYAKDVRFHHYQYMSETQDGFGFKYVVVCPD